jgi:hypothetical protein
VLFNFPRENFRVVDFLKLFWVQIRVVLLETGQELRAALLVEFWVLGDCLCELLGEGLVPREGLLALFLLLWGILSAAFVESVQGGPCCVCGTLLGLVVRGGLALWHLVFVALVLN